MKIVIYSAEAVVLDDKGSRLVSCPTEDEALEYIREQEEGMNNED